METHPCNMTLLLNQFFFLSSREGDGGRDRSNSSSQKTISEDTKALIKAALMNSALKNHKKDRLGESYSWKNIT